ncbi:MAG: hypothetical protein AAFP77_22890 [Bacteroidota bacterium]
MELLLNAPEQILGLAALLALLFVLGGKGRTLDIQLHSTYYVLHLPLIAVGFAVILGINSLIYWLLPKTTLVPWLTLGHVVLLLLSMLVLLLLAFFFRTLVVKYSIFGSLQRIILRAVGLLLLGQVLGIANWL